ncbi:uncharacterized protein BO80DRAFT_105881 [Aspergillus ibericus CBS 121593]|uniref:Uncharacterized protein n=1 Tax=Aspergillus ibericus CBS 121593 TaxID=1448316 RepID=A0A395GXJ4_9EURO|nr:hypothetical protein BO80DRAFT_105881 [Aspergillus ibericus CBS 121593]RAL00332.1 hypothetical protein BO80DRAFT_105881 [Aspergillus ibericus CBS 121593]
MRSPPSILPLPTARGHTVVVTATCGGVESVCLPHGACFSPSINQSSIAVSSLSNLQRSPLHFPLPPHYSHRFLSTPDRSYHYRPATLFPHPGGYSSVRLRIDEAAYWISDSAHDSGIFRGVRFRISPSQQLCPPRPVKSDREHPSHCLQPFSTLEPIVPSTYLGGVYSAVSVYWIDLLSTLPG